MDGIFISYRRGDHIDVVSALDRRLVESFGSDQVFLDTASLRPGDRFPGKLEKAVLDSAVVLAVIHAQWLAECTVNGVRRLDEPNDWARKELELAVQNGKKIIPILLDETPMPRRKQLPESIRDVADCQAHRDPCRCHGGSPAGPLRGSGRLTDRGKRRQPGRPAWTAPGADVAHA